MLFSMHQERKLMLMNSGEKRIHSIIISAGVERGDSLHKDLDKKLAENEDMTTKCHKSCVSSYVSVEHCARKNVTQSKLP